MLINFRTFVYVMPLVLITVCQPLDAHELKRSLVDVKHHYSKLALVLPEYKSTPVFKLSSGQRNPFVKASNVDVSKDSLQAYPLDTLRLVGVIRQGSKVSALISQPTGQINTVRVNDVIGNKKARVLRILDHSIKIEEKHGSAIRLQKTIITLHIR